MLGSTASVIMNPLFGEMNVRVGSISLTVLQCYSFNTSSSYNVTACSALQFAHTQWLQSVFIVCVSQFFARGDFQCRNPCPSFFSRCITCSKVVFACVCTGWRSRGKSLGGKNILRNDLTLRPKIPTWSYASSY